MFLSIQRFAERLRDSLCKRDAAQLREFSRQSMGFRAFDVQRHLVPRKNDLLPRYHGGTLLQERSQHRKRYSAFLQSRVVELLELKRRTLTPLVILARVQPSAPAEEVHGKLAGR